jgi:hypothetical protein
VQLLGYTPTGLADVAVVEQTGWAVKTAEVSPFTNPAKLAVIAGTPPPNAIVALLAVIVSGAPVTVTVPGT